MASKIFKSLSLITLMSVSPAAAHAEDFLWQHVEGLSPREVGELALSGLDHREIVHVEAPGDRMLPPEEHRLTLYEMPQRLGTEGCVRQVWPLTLRETPYLSELHRQIELDRRSSRTQVALSPDRPCIVANYAYAAGLTAGETLEGLVVLQEWRSQERELDCSDTSGNAICERPRYALSIARSATPTMVGRNADGWWFALEEGGRLMISIDPDTPARMRRAMPVPF